MCSIHLRYITEIAAWWSSQLLNCHCRNVCPGLKCYLLSGVQGFLFSAWTSTTQFRALLVSFSTKVAKLIKLLPRVILATINWFFIKQSKGSFTVDFFSGRLVKLVEFNRVVMTNRSLLCSSNPSQACQLLASHAGVLYQPKLVCHSKDSNNQVKLPLNFHLHSCATDSHTRLIHSWVHLSQAPFCWLLLLLLL